MNINTIRLICTFMASSVVIGCSSDANINSDEGGNPSPATSRIAGFFQSSDGNDVSEMYVNYWANGLALQYTLSEGLNCFITQQYQVSWTGNDSDLYLVSASGSSNEISQTIVRNEDRLQITYQDDGQTHTKIWFTVVGLNIEDLAVCKTPRS